MSSAAFDWVCERLETSTALNRLEARGTLRLALKQAGLDARTVSVEQLTVVIRRILPGELERRGLGNAAVLCARLEQQLASGRIDAEADDLDSPEAIFARLSGRTR